MDLSALLPAIDGAVGLDRLRSRMSASDGLVLGVSDGAKAVVLAALARHATEPILVVTPRPQHAETLADELRAWLGDHAGRVLLFPERDALPFERLAPDPEDVQRRLAVLDALGATAGDAPVIVACAAAIAQRTLTPDEVTRATIRAERGGQDPAGRAAAGARRGRVPHRAAGERAGRGFETWGHRRCLAACGGPAAAHRAVRGRDREHPLV